MELYKCKLCGSEARQTKEGIFCSKSKCQLNKSYFTPEQWNLLNKTFVPIVDEKPEKEGEYFVKLSNGYHAVDIWMLDKFRLNGPNVVSWMKSGD